MLRRLIQTGLRVTALSALVSTTALVAVAAAAAFGIYGGGGGSGKFAATFEARAVGDPSITSCPALPAVQKLEARYGGTMTIDGEEYFFNFTTLEALVDRSAGLGSAEGRWQLTDPRTGNVVGRGELIATVTADPPTEAEPPDPELELHGLLIGEAQPPDPDLPAQKLLGNVTVSITDGTHVTGAVGGPAGTSSIGLLMPAVKC